MNTTQQTKAQHVQEFRITVGGDYVSIYRGNARSPLHFFYHSEWAPQATTPDEAVREVMARFFGKGAGFVRRDGSTLKIPQTGLDRIGLSLAKAAWVDSTGKASDSSVVVPNYRAFVATAKISPTSRAAYYGYDEAHKG